MHDLPSLPEVAVGLRTGRFSSLELTRRAIANHRVSDGSLGAYVFFDEDRALREAQAADEAFVRGEDLGPWQGIPVSIKDLFGLPGTPTFAGSAHRLPAEWEQAGSLVRTLQAQRAVIMGKTHTVEFAFGGLGYNPHWPTPRNPHDRHHHRVPGGSSSGAGVSIVCGSALAAFGTDTAGSVRIPASMTGCVGLKTTQGRWPTDGMVPLSPSLDSVGVLTRNVADAAYAFYAVDPEFQGAAVTLDEVRFAVLRGALWQDCSPGILEATDRAIGVLSQTGARCSDADFAPLDEVLACFRAGGLAAPEFRAFIRTRLPLWQGRIDTRVWQRVDAAGELSDVDVDRRRARLADWAGQARTAFDGCDIWITPTVAITPPRVDEIRDPDAYRAANLLALRNPAPANLLHLCALTLPCGFDAQGLPVGLQLLAPGGGEARLLDIGRAIEAAFASAQLVSGA